MVSPTLAAPLVEPGVTEALLSMLNLGSGNVGTVAVEGATWSVARGSSVVGGWSRRGGGVGYRSGVDVGLGHGVSRVRHAGLVGSRSQEASGR